MAWWETEELLKKLWRDSEEIGRTYRRWYLKAEDFSAEFPLAGEYPEGVKLRSLVRKARREAAARRYKERLT
jgi:hypothetical protein